MSHRRGESPGVSTDFARRPGPSAQDLHEQHPRVDDRAHEGADDAGDEPGEAAAIDIGAHFGVAPPGSSIIRAPLALPPPGGVVAARSPTRRGVR